MQGDQRSEEFGKINPTKRVPAMVDTSNGLALTESCAIMRYLANNYLSEGNQYYPRDNFVEQSEIEQAMSDYHTRYRTVAMAGYARLIAPLFNVEKSYDLEKIDLGIHEILGELDLKFKDQEYLTSLGRMTLPDLLYYCELVNLSLVNFPIEKYQYLIGWMKRMRGDQHAYIVNFYLREMMSGKDDLRPVYKEIV